MRAVKYAGAALLVWLLIPLGCKQVGSAIALLRPPDVRNKEFTLTKGRLAVLIETARPQEENPVFTQALHEKLVEEFRDRKINDQVVPLEEVIRLRQARPESANWSYARIGRALAAEQVVYIWIEHLESHAKPDQPVFEPQVQLRLKVYSVDEKAETPRLWPGKAENDGRLIERKRQLREAADAMTTDAEITKLGHDAALLVAMPFYDVYTEEKTPWEQ